MRATVVGGGISGAACANALVAAGVEVTLRDRGRRLGGRMASRILRDTGTAHDGRPVDIGASYFTAREPAFIAQVEEWVAAGVVRPWTDSFHVATPEGISGVRSGPMRYAAPRGLRSVVEAMVDPRVEVRSEDDVAELPTDRPVALCMPLPQARRLYSALPESSITWEPVIAVTSVFDDRTWLDIDGVFVNDDPVLTWIADDGRRRGDDAPVLVAHVHPVLSAGHLQDPAAVVPQAVAAVRRVLGIADYPTWVDAHRWTFAKPLEGHADPFWLSADGQVGVAGDLWSGGPRVEAAWLSGHALGTVLGERAVGAPLAER